MSEKQLEKERGANFYKERRLATKSPLGTGSDAKPEQIMDDISRGALTNKSSLGLEPTQQNLGNTITENIAEEKKRGGVVGFFRRRFKRNNK